MPSAQHDVDVDVDVAFVAPRFLRACPSRASGDTSARGQRYGISLEDPFGKATESVRIKVPNGNGRVSQNGTLNIPRYDNSRRQVRQFPRNSSFRACAEGTPGIRGTSRRPSTARSGAGYEEKAPLCDQSKRKHRPQKTHRGSRKRTAACVRRYASARAHASWHTRF